MQIPLTAEDAFISTDIKPMPKLVNINTNSIQGGISSMRPHEKPSTGRQVSETDLYLLGAIEKLVYRADFMEKRLRKVEEMLHFVMAGSRVDKGIFTFTFFLCINSFGNVSEPCPINFMRAGTNCYYFSDLAGREKDWKAAMQHCKKMGGSLAELETIEENQDVIVHIQTNSHLRGAQLEQARKYIKINNHWFQVKISGQED